MGFLKADAEPKRKWEDLDLAEFGGSTIRVQQLSAGLSLEMAKMRKKEPFDPREASVFLIRHAVVDEAFKPMFPDEKAASGFLSKVSNETSARITEILAKFEKRPNPAEGDDEVKSEGSPSSSSSSA